LKQNSTPRCSSPSTQVASAGQIDRQLADQHFLPDAAIASQQVPGLSVREMENSGPNASNQIDLYLTINFNDSGRTSLAVASR